MTNTLSDMAYFYYNGRKVSYYDDLVEDLKFDRVFEEDIKKMDQIEDRILRLQRRAHSILKPKSLLEKASYEVGRFIGN
jgi:hypothetical protein